MEKNHEMLLEKGQRFYKLGAILCKVLIGSVALLVATLLIAVMIEGGSAFIMCLTFRVAKIYAFVKVLVGVSYLGILVGAVGPKLYFNGLHLLGLGQIAKNTDKQ